MAEGLLEDWWRRVTVVEDGHVNQSVPLQGHGMSPFPARRATDAGMVGLDGGHEQLITTSCSSPHWTGVAETDPRISSGVVHHVLSGWVVSVVPEVVVRRRIIEPGDHLILMKPHIGVVIGSSELDGHIELVLG